MHEFNDACVKTSDQSLTKDATIDRPLQYRTHMVNCNEYCACDNIRRRNLKELCLRM